MFIRCTKHALNFSKSSQVKLSMKDVCPSRLASSYSFNIDRFTDGQPAKFGVVKKERRAGRDGVVSETSFFIDHPLF